jgi:hypothetical protein
MRKTTGTVLELPCRRDAEGAVAQLRIEVNEKPASLGEIIERYGEMWKVGGQPISK